LRLSGAAGLDARLRLDLDLRVSTGVRRPPARADAWAFVAALTCYRVQHGVGLVALHWAAIIGVSTLYTKQHYVVDVVAGIAIAYAAYLLFLRGYPREAIAETDRRLGPKRALRALWLYSAVVAFLWAYRFAVTW
jgi:membrane-associated phospholipid phosphatase